MGPHMEKLEKRTGILGNGEEGKGPQNPLSNRHGVEKFIA